MNQNLKPLFESCRQAGIKVTQQRIEIFKAVVSMENHPTAALVHEKLRQNLPTVSLDTVYRNLWMFRDLGLINTLGTVRESARFDANLDPHHHFVCKRCGQTKDVHFELPNNFPPQSFEMGKVNEIHVEVHGICKQCMSS